MAMEEVIESDEGGDETPLDYKILFFLIGTCVVSGSIGGLLAYFHVPAAIWLFAVAVICGTFAAVAMMTGRGGMSKTAAFLVICMFLGVVYIFVGAFNADYYHPIRPALPRTACANFLVTEYQKEVPAPEGFCTEEIILQILGYQYKPIGDGQNWVKKVWKALIEDFKAGDPDLLRYHTVRMVYYATVEKGLVERLKVDPMSLTTFFFGISCLLNAIVVFCAMSRYRMPGAVTITVFFYGAVIAGYSFLSWVAQGQSDKVLPVLGEIRGTGMAFAVVTVALPLVLGVISQGSGVLFNSIAQTTRSVVIFRIVTVASIAAGIGLAGASFFTDPRVSLLNWFIPDLINRVIVTPGLYLGEALKAFQLGFLLADGVMDMVKAFFVGAIGGGQEMGE